MKLKQLLLCFSLTMLFNHPVFAQDGCTEHEINKNVQTPNESAVIECGSKAVEPLINIIHDYTNTKAQSSAVTFLQEIIEKSKEESDIEKGTNSLIDILKQKNVDPGVRNDIVSALGDIGKKSQSHDLKLQIVNTLVGLLNDQKNVTNLSFIDLALNNLKEIAQNLENNINQNKDQFSSKELNQFIEAFNKAFKFENRLNKENVDNLRSIIDSLRQKQNSSWQKKITKWIGQSLLIQVGFWVVLIFIYPNSSQVQAIFFWNPKVRKIIGLWYVDLALTWIPFLRYRLLIPFKDSFLSDADLDNFDPHTYFANSSVKLQDSIDSQFIQEAIPEIKGQIIIEGESGLGKSMFLRNLVKSSQGIVIYLPADKCEKGVMEAIQDKLHGYVKEDPNFLKSLVYSGAIDICIDGLNEVTLDTRAKITSFVESYFKGNIIMATQPLEWTAPSTAKTY